MRGIKSLSALGVVWSFVILLECVNRSHSPSVCLTLSLCSAQQQAFLLENVACDNVSCKDVGRMFRVHWDQSDLNAIPRAAVATFFDIYEDVSL